MSAYYLEGPLSEADVTKLNIGDVVYLSGSAFTCRSRFQRYIFDENNKFPFDLGDRNILIHTGIIAIRENNKWKLVSFIPTRILFPATRARR
jgi:fumarate hydratase subunit beta